MRETSAKRRTIKEPVTRGRVTVKEARAAASEESIVAKEVLSAEEAARFLEVSIWTVRQMAHNGQLPARKIGRAWRFSRRALLEWLGEGGCVT